MNYIERALERVNKIIEQSEENSDEQIDFIVVKQACEKQVSEKPRKKYLFGNGICNSCGENINDKSNYCWNCGQKIDWSEVANE